MADLDGDAGPLADRDRLGDGVEHGVVLAADVAGVDALVRRDGLGERDEFVGRGVDARHVDQARRHAERARAHALVDERRHARQFASVGRAVRGAEHRAADGAVADEAAVVDADAALLQAREVRPEVLDRAAAVAGDHRRDPHAQEVGTHGFADDLGVDVDVHVDEPRRHGEPVDAQGRRAGRRRHGTDGGDAAAADADVSHFAGPAGAVVHDAAAEHEVEGRAGRGRRRLGGRPGGEQQQAGDRGETASGHAAMVRAGRSVFAAARRGLRVTNHALRARCGVGHGA
ncbi:MAG: hypothetical protein ACK56S_07155 [Planctomycetota bacterium]